MSSLLYITGTLPCARRLNALRLARHLREVRRIRCLADAGLLVALDPLEQALERADRIVDRSLHVAELREPRRHRREREVLALDVGQLVPRHRGRHGRVRQRPDRVRARDRAVARVLVVVDEDLLPALLLPPRGGHELGGAPLDLPSERERTPTYDGKRPARLDPHRDVDPTVPRRLRPPDVVEL